MTLSLLLVADSDSQLLACQALARCADGHRARVTVNAVPREGTPAAVLEALQSDRACAAAASAATAGRQPSG